MKYKIVQNIDEDSYTLCSAHKEEPGNIILLFEAESYEEAMFIRNQFLHFEPYRPFDKFWIGSVGHFIYVDNQILEKDNYEIRTLVVLAEDESDAKTKLELEATKYSKPYENVYGKEVIWKFDKIMSVEIMDFFSTIDLYRGFLLK